ncbi:MAG: hypothetical protein HDT46_04930 [Ruminococcaceae bacterium]|nr:hypothetical protein [Oscillospiraceae bacterium]MBD5117069.1 hypothetical protein [Oscillospiraceae bacterium]
MKKKGKTGLFLMELMISLLIFAVCACVCAAIIAKASSSISESRDMSNALILSQNKAELIKSGKYNDNDTEYYNADLKSVEKENAVYSAVSAVSSKDNGVTEYTVEIYRTADNKLIYNINSAYYS